MIRAWPHPGDLQVIQIAQYLSSLTTHQEVWTEAGKALVKFLDAQVVAFGHLREEAP